MTLREFCSPRVAFSHSLTTSGETGTCQLRFVGFVKKD